MPEARSTQEVLQVAAIVTPPAVAARVTQTVLQVVATTAVPPISARVTQTVLQVLANAVPCVTQWTVAWIITRTDGTVHGFTALDVPITVEGVDCQPCYSLSVGAIELGSPLGNVGNQEVSGIISSDAISSNDLLQGRFDFADVAVWQIAWVPDPNDPSRATRDLTLNSKRRLMRGKIGRVSQGDTTFSAEVLTDGAALEQTALVKTYAPGCRWVQYDSRCGLSFDTHKVAGTVTAIPAVSVYSQSVRRIFFDDTRTEATGTFDRARTLNWLTGANAGQVSEVTSWDLASYRFVLRKALPSPIQVGDTYEVAPSCQNNVAGCKAFSNFLRYGGFRDVPGQDKIIEAPDAKG